MRLRKPSQQRLVLLQSMQTRATASASGKTDHWVVWLETLATKTQPLARSTPLAVRPWTGSSHFTTLHLGNPAPPRFPRRPSTTTTTSNTSPLRVAPQVYPMTFRSSSTRSRAMATAAAEAAARRLTATAHAVRTARTEAASLAPCPPIAATTEPAEAAAAPVGMLRVGLLMARILTSRLAMVRE